MTKIINSFPNYTISPTGEIVNKHNQVKSQWLGANGYLHVDIYHEGISKKVAVHRLLATHFIPNPENKRTVNHIDGNKQNNALDNLEWATDSENVKHAYDTGLQSYRREYTLVEYEAILKGRFLQGETITAIAETSNNCLTQLSLHLREAAERLGLLEEYEAQLVIQKTIRAAATGKAQRKSVNLQMISMDTNEVVNTFTSLVEAQKFLGKKSSGPISNVLAGRQKSAYGYKWEKL